MFDRRYKFYKRVDKLWRSTGDEAQGATMPYLDWDDIEALVIEANFLFGPDIEKHLRSYEGKSFDGVPWLPDSALLKPFNKYLAFEEKGFLERLRERFRK